MEDLAYALKISVIGIAIVFVGLILIEWILRLFQVMDAWISRSKKEGPETKAQEAITKEISDERLAVIAAAVEASIGKAKLKRIRYRKGRFETTWASMGRAAVMASRKIEHKKG